jgi:hypothetical protein
MRTLIKRSWFLLVPFLLAGCGDKSSESGPTVILTNQLDITPGAVAAPTHVDIAGVSREEEVSLIDLLHVSGLLTRGTQQVAIINNSVVSMGEEMQVTANGQDYKLRVLSITDDSIRLVAKPVEQEF